MYVYYNILCVVYLLFMLYFKTSCVLLLVVLCVLLLLYVCIAVFTLDAGLLARSQYSEDPGPGHLGTGFSWFPCVYKQMLRWFPRLQVATTCFSCSPPSLNLLVSNFIFYIYIYTGSFKKI